MNIEAKIEILAAAARYDVSCASSGSRRAGPKGKLGNATESGVCHTFTEDGRCVSLLKILQTNHCVYDCAYCVNRSGNDIPRARFSVRELVDLTLNFYRRNFIEGLFLSSGVIRSPDDTMERMVAVARELRRRHGYNGYIHLKCIPGASNALIEAAGRYADRLSVNIELPSEPSLEALAHRKSYADILGPMKVIRSGIEEYRTERRRSGKTPLFAPAGQSTQMIIGASPESDWDILRLARDLYQRHRLKRVYFSGYLPIPNPDRILLNIREAPLVRENRLYQADWLMRLYGFDLDDILSPDRPRLDLSVDPKMGYALSHPDRFPVDVNRADYEAILRVPGIGIRSAKTILACRRQGEVRYEHLRQMGVVLKRAASYIRCPGHPSGKGPTKRRAGPGAAGTGAMEREITFVYDGTFEGFLSGIFDSYARKLFPSRIERQGLGQRGVFETCETIPSDPEKAARVWRRLQELFSTKGAKRFYLAFLSGISGIEMTIYNCVRSMLDDPTGRSDPERLNGLLSITRISRKVRREAHRMRGLVRFVRLEGDLYGAAISPDYDVLPLIHSHFERRFADQRWMIFDVKRDYGFYFDRTALYTLASHDFSEKQVSLQSALEVGPYESLWKTYFGALNIPERRNLKLHLQKLPRRYWMYLPEKQAG